jgi:DNA-binding IclR family transcriptional regulator
MLLKELHLRTRLSISLTTPNGLFMQILHIEMPHGQHTERGLQIGLFGSAIGSAYIASLPDDEIEDLVSRAGLDRRVLPAMLDTARKVRQDGYADGVGPDEAVWTIAMPIPEAISPLPMVLAVAGEKRAVEPRVPELKALMANCLDHWLGANGAS